MREKRPRLDSCWSVRVVPALIVLLPFFQACVPVVLAIPTRRQSHLRNDSSVHRQAQVVPLQVKSNEPVDCTKYQFSKSLTKDLILNYVVNVDDESSGGGTFSAELVYQGTAWLGFAVAPTGKMNHSLAIMGLPINEDEGGKTEESVRIYRLPGSQEQNTSSGMLLEPLPSQQHTLMNSTIVQDGETTTMSFTKWLRDEGDVGGATIDANGQIIFIFAHGASNQLGYHASRGVVVLAMEPCNKVQDRHDTNDYVIVDGIIPIPEPPKVEAATEAPIKTMIFPRKSYSRTFWLIHGVFGAFACGVLLPMALGSSLLRCICCVDDEDADDHHGEKATKRRPTWLSFYVGFNLLVAVFVAVAFSMAMVGTASDAQHEAVTYNLNSTRSYADIQAQFLDQEAYLEGVQFSYKHRIAGWTIFVFLLVHAALGWFRFYLATPRGLIDKVRKGKDEAIEVELQHQNIILPACTEDKQEKRDIFVFIRVWDASHGVVGAILVFISWWHCNTGLALYGSRFPTDAALSAPLVWGMTGTVAGIIGFFWLLKMAYFILKWYIDTTYR